VRAERNTVRSRPAATKEPEFYRFGAFGSTPLK
jgi:hypothetical protein